MLGNAISVPSLALCCALAVGAASYLVLWRRGGVGSGRSCQLKRGCGVIDLIGETPLVELRSLSEQTGCRILAKVEFVQPGGSVKDRVAKQIILEAAEQGLLRPGQTVYEGTAGSTGISLALVANAKGYRCHICMPDDQAVEKVNLLTALGATVERVRPASIVDPFQFVNLARMRAKESGGFFADQFENLANFRAHYNGTGREIWEQTRGRLDAVVLAAGTGGTIAGISRYIKERRPDVQVCLIDPPGSSLYNKVVRGVMFDAVEKEGTRKKHPCDTITEGIGINRQTRNFAEAQIDCAFRGTDREAVEMAAYLLRNEGLFVGSSSAMNCVGAVKLARSLGGGKTIVTVLCDSGQRHLSRFHNREYLHNLGLTPTSTGTGLGFVS